MTKNKISIIYIIGFLLSFTYSYSQADILGCCTNPGAGGLACTTDRLVKRDQECCPRPETNFTSYYKSPQNSYSPLNHANCSFSFFFPNADCGNVNACSLGCCCSEFGGTIVPEARCKASNLIFHRGITDCNRICPSPQCRDNIDNDNNGCADFEGGDLGCLSPSDNQELGGSCSVEGAGCTDPTYVPKLSNLDISPAKGEKKFSLRWRDECSRTITFYEIMRCRDRGCTNFALMGTSNTNTFEDSSSDLLFNVTYTFLIKAHYALQAAVPTINKTASLGNSECVGQFTTSMFCLNDTAFFCDSNNKLIPEGTKCPSNQICIVSNNKPSCVNKITCNYRGANPFGLFYTIEGCENGRYCFYDKSYSTVNSCFSCNPSMSCYDYKTEESCNRDNCGVRNCKWKSIENQIGTGVCVSTDKYNCPWCDKKGANSMENQRSFNEVFDICTREKSRALSEGEHKCYFRDEKSKNCGNVVCRDYDSSQCSSTVIKHDRNNIQINPSSDDCGIKLCQNINSMCVKNADGDGKADCESADCEKDYFAPNATLIPITTFGVTDGFAIQIYDRTSFNSSVLLVTSPNYVTYLCVEPLCNPNGHPYNAFTTSRRLIVSGLSVFDGTTGLKLLTLNEGNNLIKYYSQDPAKNIGTVKEISAETHKDTSRPSVLGINVTNSTKVLDKFYTRTQKPTIDVFFFEPAIMTYSRLINKRTGLTITFDGNTQPRLNVSLPITQVLPDEQYTFQLNAKNTNNVLLSSLYTAAIVIDNSRPSLSITPANGSLINESPFKVGIIFNEEVNLNSVKINSEDITTLFSTSDNKVFNVNLNVSDGNKIFEVIASDYTKNQVIGRATFTVDTNPTDINLLKPKFGVAAGYTFDIVVGTDNSAECRFELDDNLEFAFMNRFASTGDTTHTISNFNRILSGDNRSHNLYIRCKDNRYGIASKMFSLSIDTTQPRLKNLFAFPNPVVERPITTTLTVETDEPVLCMYSNISTDFDSMEGKFDGYDNNTFRIISRKEITVENEGSYTYNVACKNKAELNSEAKQITFTADLTQPMTITSHSPQFFGTNTVTLRIQTNKIAQCKYSETDKSVQTGQIFGEPAYAHTKQLILPTGKHIFYIICKDQYLQQWSSVFELNLTIDVTNPSMLYVSDSSIYAAFPEKTCNNDRLRVKYLGEDAESGIKNYSYSIIKKLDNKAAVNWTDTLWHSQSGEEWRWITNLNLEDNTEYLFNVKSRNYLGAESSPKASDGIIVEKAACEVRTCGDGLINQPGEECDENTFGSISSCLNFTNFIGGNLRCASNCKLDTSGCTRVPECGNSYLEPGETCDGTKFGAIDSCVKFASFSGGTLKCTSTCQLDTSSCIEKPKCGNSFIDTGEICDGTNLGSLNGKCSDYSSTFTGGSISCINCNLDTSKCQGVQGTCGDAIVNIGEACDGANYGQINKCSDIASFSEGTIGCTSSCQLNTSSCIEKPKCGNSFIDLGESCDTNNLGPLNSDCIDYSPEFNDGNLNCIACKLSTSNCIKTPQCGNNKLDTGEACDGSNFGGIANLSCTNYKNTFKNGTISCKSCKISTDTCDSDVASVQITCRERGTCQTNEPCNDNSDCENRFCSAGRCKEPRCDDGIKNQDESDIDCGGVCSSKCQNGKACQLNTDCQSGYCGYGACSDSDKCYDTQLTPGESDIDCGGPCPTKCSEGASCEVDIDCQNGLQCMSSICRRGEQVLVDTDADGLPDEWEIKNGLNPNDSSDAGLDSDEDGLNNYEEFQVESTYGESTDPNNLDTDGDGFSDKEEVDKGTSPIDPEDFPKSSKLTILLFVLGILILVSGFGYLAYRVVKQRREQSFEIPKRETTRPVPQQQFKQVQVKPRQEEFRLKEEFNKRQQIKDKERRKLFQPFKQETVRKDIQKESQPKQEIKAKESSEKIAPKKKVRKSVPKQKEDVFVKLKEIAKETKKKRKSK